MVISNHVDSIWITSVITNHYMYTQSEIGNKLLVELILAQLCPIGISDALFYFVLQLLDNFQHGLPFLDRI